MVPQRSRQDVVEDVEWLLGTGETHPEAVANRLGYRTTGSLYRALHRADRGDLVDQLRREPIAEDLGRWLAPAWA